MKKRIAVVEKNRCNPVDCGNFLCMKLCPLNRSGVECIKNMGSKPFIDEALCNGCGICQNRCPFEAISIINLPAELDKDPVHRYGGNGFALYSLPIPIFGKVTGIIGKNGIGKSTALNILAGILKPNFGREKSGTYEELVDYFKGTEAQIFFEKLKNRKIKVSYKPQQVDMIPKQYSGKVIELLRKIDEKNQLDEVARKLELVNVLESKLNEISGGELQRVAIAACALKKANVYFFDEPTSYLDIKQRLIASKFIKSLATPETAVMVVEHDLIILDHMTDLVHILYGKPSCYGIVSQPKTSRIGINVYLDGFLKEENIRFRDYQIKFEVRPPSKNIQLSKLVEWSSLKKTLGQFSLAVHNGFIQNNSVTGILGENGIGKTSFVRMLAMEIDSDKGEISRKIRVAYKPQYINSDSDELVMAVLSEATSKYNAQLVEPLKLQQLLLRKINELSGGELQRVAIAACLAKDADLYLLDEPSAYLDVEQRLIAAKIINNTNQIRGKSTLVVDHDLMFIDNISDSLFVFEGKPAIRGECYGPFDMESGMTKFLKYLRITLRRDKESHRPRINKADSVKDREQKAANKYYYS